MELATGMGYTVEESARLTAEPQAPRSTASDNVFWTREVRPFAAQLALTLSLAAFGLSLAGCRSTPPPTPLAELNPQQMRGHDVFRARCAACHYDRQSGPLHGPSLLGLYKKPALPSGAAPTDERVAATILHGRNQMPGMASKLDGTDLDDLIAYLHTL
jgi:mono/diheme cytochrome c family protein